MPTFKDLPLEINGFKIIKDLGFVIHKPELSYAQLALIYNVNRSTIAAIIKYKSWSNI